ncbi:MAG: Type II secretion system (T2SS) [Verrucomicrobia bacterium]|nr:MAG: Type II secretion system (T2SS) [Verrucomicrobiota bacterium]
MISLEVGCVLARNVARERATHARPACINRASVLVIVLVTLLFTSVALVAFIEQASNDLLVESRVAAAKRLRREAYSALEVTLATLQSFSQADNGLHSPAEGWGDPLGFAGWTPREGCTAEVTFEDESGKIPLTRVDAATFVNLFVSWKMAPPDAEKLADALLGWMKKDYVPASGAPTDYDQMAIPYAAPGRALRSYSELAAIDEARVVFYDKQDRPNDLWRRFAATFSLFDYPQADLNSAQPDVLAALGFSDLSQQQRLADYLAGKGASGPPGPRWFTSANAAASVLGSGALPPLAGVQIRALRIGITIREGRSVFRLTTVVTPATDGATLVQETVSLSGAPTETNDTATGVMVSVFHGNMGSNIGHVADQRDKMVQVELKPAGGPPPTPGPATGAIGVRFATGTPANPSPKLNYPFTLLEIWENAEMPPAPPAPPDA